MNVTNQSPMFVKSSGTGYPIEQRIVHAPRTLGWSRCALVVALVTTLFARNAAFAQGFSFEGLRARAREMAKIDRALPAVNDLPDWLAKLDYDGYRRLRFRRETCLWAGDNTPFRMQFMHRGYLFPRKVPISVIDGADVRELRFSPDQFDYGERKSESVPPDLGYSGFALLHQVVEPGRWDEVASFQGASYFRLLAAGQVYGASARGLAIDTASPKGEEFPEFVEFWIEKPHANATQVTAYALLDSASVTGAYQFVLTPGKQTRADVKASLFPRRAIQKLGLAPLTSMFLFGEARTDHLVDWRPEVHDSDGLLVAKSDGTWLWRPLSNPQHTHRITRFDLENPAGFGLLQRDRAFESYEDLEARFESRPSYWLTLHGAWGKGAVELVEIPSTAEWNDNIVAYWTPDKVPAKGEELTLEYALSAYTDDPTPPALGHVTSTRVRSRKDVQLTVLDFMGAEVEGSRADLKADISVTRGQVRNVVLERNDRTGGERCSFELVDSSTEPLEMRVTLRRGERAISETLVLPWVKP